MLNRNEQVMEANSLSPKSRITLDLLGLVIVNQPLEVIELLSKYGSSINRQSSDQEIVGAVLTMLKEENRQFNYDLAALLVQAAATTGESLEENNYAPFSGDAGVNIGLDPVSAVAGAVGSIANLLGHSRQKKLIQQQAQAQTLSKIIAYKTQQHELQAKQKKKAFSIINNVNMLKIAGVLTLSALLLWWLFKEWPLSPLT